MKKSKNLNSKLKAPDSLGPVLATILGVFVTLLFPAMVCAQNSVSQSFGVDPLKIVENVSTGNPVEVPIKIYNLKNVELDYILSVERFEVKDERGSLEFTELGTVDNKKEPEIILNESQVTIPANSSRTVITTISVEKQVPPKEFFYTIFATPVPISNGIEGNITSVQGKIGILTFVNVVKPGEILGELVKSGSIVRFDAPAWDLRSPIQFSAIINNTGTIHFDAYGTLKIYNSKDQLAKTVSLKKATVLPGATRILESSDGEKLLWDFGLRFGKHKGILNVKSADGTLNMEETVEFFLLPTMPVLTLIIIILSLTILVVIRRRLRKVDDVD